MSESNSEDAEFQKKDPCDQYAPFNETPPTCKNSKGYSSKSETYHTSYSILSKSNTKSSSFNVSKGQDHKDSHHKGQQDHKDSHHKGKGSKDHKDFHHHKGIGKDHKGDHKGSKSSSKFDSKVFYSGHELSKLIHINSSSDSSLVGKVPYSDPSNPLSILSEPL